VKMKVHGSWKRWVKRFLGIDPLVGMYAVSYPAIGILLDRVETAAGPQYLYCNLDRPTSRNSANSYLLNVTEMRSGPNWNFFYTLEKAQKWWSWYQEQERSTQARAEALRYQVQVGAPN